MLTEFYFSTVPSRELVFTWGKKKILIQEHWVWSLEIHTSAVVELWWKYFNYSGNHNIN